MISAAIDQTVVLVGMRQDEMPLEAGLPGDGDDVSRRHAFFVDPETIHRLQRRGCGGVFRAGFKRDEATSRSQGGVRTAQGGEL